MKNYLSGILLFTFLLTLSSCTEKSILDKYPSVDILDSGTPLLAEQLTFDISFYDINLEVDPEQKWIGGHTVVTSIALEDLDNVVLNFDTLLTVSAISVNDESIQESDWEHTKGFLAVSLPNKIDANSSFSVRVDYAGYPRYAENADDVIFGDGFYFEQTPDGQPWVNMITVLTGADIWYPTKDHPSDEPDSMAINIKVPNDLSVASNGKLRSIIENDDDTRTHQWFVSTPINNFGVTLNIAPYTLIEAEYESITGQRFPYQIWTLQEKLDDAKQHLSFMQDKMDYLENLLGPYPFSNDKAGVAQTYYGGMETQTIIAQTGRLFGVQSNNYLHGLAHEWLANMVTAGDWKDVWIHESTVSYIVAIYIEDTSGYDAYNDYMQGKISRISNNKPLIVAEEQASVREALALDDPIVSLREDFHMDIYDKGPAILHTLRFLTGREVVVQSLQQLAYPYPALKDAADGSQYRFTDTEEYIGMIEELYGKELDWFFDAYLYHANPPKLISEESDNSVRLKWESPSEKAFILPVPVQVDGEYTLIPMTDGTGSFTYSSDYTLDPKQEVYSL